MQQVIRINTVIGSIYLYLFSLFFNLPPKLLTTKDMLYEVLRNHNALPDKVIIGNSHLNYLAIKCNTLLISG